MAEGITKVDTALLKDSFYTKAEINSNYVQTRTTNGMLEYWNGTEWAQVGGGLYKASNTVRVSWPTERINTQYQCKLIGIFYAITSGEVKISFEMKAGSYVQSWGPVLYAQTDISTSNSGSSTGTKIIGNRKNNLYTDSVVGLEGNFMSEEFMQATSLGGGTSVPATYTTFSSYLRIERPGPVFLFMYGHAGSGAVMLNCGVKNFTISYDIASGG